MQPKNPFLLTNSYCEAFSFMLSFILVSDTSVLTFPHTLKELWQTFLYRKLPSLITSAMLNYQERLRFEEQASIFIGHAE